MALIKEKLSKASPSLMDAVVVNCISRFTTHDKAKDIEDFFVANPLPSSARRISQTVELIRSSASLLDQINKSKLVDASFWK